MDFSWTEEQQTLRDRAIEFAQLELNDDIVARDRSGEFWRAAWIKCARFGVQGLFVPQEYGGGGYDIVSTILALEGIGYGCADNGLTLALNGQMWAVEEPILRFGSEEQKQRFLPGLCHGELLGAHGMTEPQSGSDVYNVQTVAEKRDGGYVLNGRKTLVGLAPIADLAIVFATVNPDLKQWGLTAFLVENGTPGFTRGPAQSKMGLRTVPLGELILEDCFIPESNRLGPEGAGASIFTAAMDWERSFIFASHVGAMARQLDCCLAFAAEHQRSGQPIGKFQSISNRIADMKLRLETARLLLYKAAWLKDQGQSAALDAALAKLHISEAFTTSSLDAIRIHGGAGYLTDFEVERELRDAVGGVIYSGTSDIQRNVIARLLGL